MEIIFWENGTWAVASEITTELHKWKGPNHGTLTVPDDTDDATVDKLVRDAL